MTPFQDPERLLQETVSLHLSPTWRIVGTDTVPLAAGLSGEAARCIGFRYLWWTLEEWRPGPENTAWVMHYINLILGSTR